MVGRIVLAGGLIAVLAATSYAVPVRTAEYGAVPIREFSPARDACHLVYYNYCSGWRYHWHGWRPNAKVGVCFDLTDCVGFEHACHELTDMWWAWYPMSTRGTINMEIFCADDQCCPIGPPLAGFYGLGVFEIWMHFVFNPALCLSPCASKFIVMGTLPSPEHVAIYTDNNPRNVLDGCQPSWDCVVHSWIWVDRVDYCEVYGAPQAFFLAYPGTGCYWDQIEGFAVDILCDLYLDCTGPTATEETSWSEIKSLYK